METRGHEPIRRGVSWGGTGSGPGPGSGSGSGTGTAPGQGYNSSSTTDPSGSSFGSRGPRPEMGLGGGQETIGTSPITSTTTTSSNNSWNRDENSWAKGKSAVTSADSQLGRKTNLSRSASLSEKELKEARTRSQIIAAQLSVPSNSRGVQLFNRRRQRVNAFTLVSFGEGGGGGGGGEGGGVEVEGERQGGGERGATSEEAKSETCGTPPPLPPSSSPPSPSPAAPLPWESNKRASSAAEESKDRELNRKNSETKALWSPPATAALPPRPAPSSSLHSSRGSSIMEDQGEAIREEVQEVVDLKERHFQPVQEKEEEEEEEEHLPAESVKDETAVTDDSCGAARPETGREEVKVNGTHPGNSVGTLGDIPNGCHGGAPSKPVTSVPKQSASPATIVNRTARPFFSPSTVQRSSPGPSPQIGIPPAPSYATPPLPAFPEPPALTYAVEPPMHAYAEPPRATTTGPPRQTFSPTPPAPSYPTPPLPLPSYSSLPPSTMSPVPHYVPPPASSSTSTSPKPQMYVPQMRPTTPGGRTGILDEGVVRRGPRKSMFTFQEKPKVAPNPELLSLVQGVDERKKQRPPPPGSAGGGSQAESVPEEELLALGAEASNFMASKEMEEAASSVSVAAAVVVEEMAPAWTSCLKSSRAPPPGRQVERKPEQNLSSNVSGKGADMFSRRQARMEKYVVDNPAAAAAGGGVGGGSAARRGTGQIRSPSPTMSLPPSWIYPSTMPGRVKAMANDASNISEQISKTLKAQQQQAKNVPASGQAAAARPVPQPAPQSPVLENGCTRMEMELAKHQPYQLNSSLFILSPTTTKDPMSSLPRGAPPAKTPLRGGAGHAGQPNYLTRQSSLPTHAHAPSQFSSAPASAPGGAPPGGYRQACFSPQLPLSPRADVASPVAAYTPDRVMSPRAGGGAGGHQAQAQAPRPTFSARKAGIEAQTKKEAPASGLSTPTSSRTPTLTRRFSSPEGPTNLVWSPSPSPHPNPNPNPSTPTGAPSPRLLHRAMATSPVSPLGELRCLSPITVTSSSHQDTKANHRLLAKNIINAAKRKGSPSPGALSGHGLPISPPGGVSGGGGGGGCILSYEQHKPLSPFQPRGSLGSQSPTFTSPPPTPTRMIRSPVRLYNTRSLTDSDASVESEDSGMRSPRSYNTCPRGWAGGSLRIKRGSLPGADL